MFELVVFATVSALVFAVWTMQNPPTLIAVPALFLPAAMIAGPIGLFLGGRKAFWPSAFAGAAAMYIVLLILARNAVR